MSRRNYWTTLRQRKISRRTMLGASAKAGVGAAGLALVGCGDDDEPDAGAAAAERAAAAAEEAAAAAVAAGDARAAESAAAAAVAAEAADAAGEASAAAADAADAAGEASAAASQAASAADAAAALAAEAAESEDAANAAAAAEAAAAAAAQAADAAGAAGDAAAAAVADAAAEAAEAAAQAARDVAAAVEAGTATAAAAQAAIDNAAEAAAAAAAAAGEASAAAGQAAAAAGQAAATAQETAEAAAETAAAAVAAAQEAADAAREAAESAAMAAEEEEQAVAAFADIDLDATITTAVPSDNGGLDQVRTGSHLNYISHGNVFDSAVETDPDTNAVIPHMVAAEFVDDLTMVADVRPAPFHDGSILSAEDMVFTYERAGNIAEYHQGGETSDHPAGWTSAREQYGSQLWARSEAQDARTWVVELHEPNATFIGVILPEGAQSLAIVSKAYTERVGDAVMDQEPMGTGPYRFGSHGEDTDFVFTRHDDHLNPLDHPINVRHVPFNKDLRVEVRPEVLSQIAGLEAGELDLLYGLATKDVEGFIDDPAYDIHYEGARAELLYPNLNNPVMEDGSPNPFLDIRVREAINIAINRQDIIDNLLTGTEEQPLFTPRSSFGHPSEDQIAAAGLNFPYDPERARALMAEAGYADGFDTTLHTVVGVWNLKAELSLVVQQDLAAIGIRLTIKEYTAAEYFSNAGARQRPNAPGIWSFSSAFHPDVQSVLNCCILPEGVYGISTPSDDPAYEEIVALARAQSRELDPQKRGEIITQLFLDHAKGHYHGYVVTLQKAALTRSDIRWPAGAVQGRNWNHLYAAQKLKAV